MFLESNFAYAVYDFLECKKEAGEYNRLKKRCREETLRELEEIAKEAFSLHERKMTRKVLSEMVNNNSKTNIKILNDFEEVFKYHIFLFYVRNALRKPHPLVCGNTQEFFDKG